MRRGNVVDCDPEYTLKIFRELVDQWIAEYGEDAVFYTDAGYNNVELMIRKEKRNAKV